MLKIKPKEFKRFDRMSIAFLRHLSCLIPLIKCPVVFSDYKPNFVDGDSGVHGQGIAIHFRLCDGQKIFPQTVKVLNVCNEYFKSRCGMRFRLGVYPNYEKPFFHLDTVNESLFWVGRFKFDDESQTEKIEYKFSRSMVYFLDDLDYLEDL